MTQPAVYAIEDALSRLRGALQSLESAAARRSELDRSKSTLETELALMQDDRARLAVELDGALARAQRLEATSDEVAARVERAMTCIRTVMAEAENHTT